ncbi:MAG: hypothetical protein FJY97_15210 [candidate division Zixibacteria bacterium]|nr:hypothetical protein [candidate division Zixibacteria bacterium]
MTTASMWSYTWDLTYGSVSDTIGRLKNEIGLDTVSVATSYHTYEMLCGYRKGRKFLWEPQAAVYFQPDLSFYADTPIKPHVSPSATESDPLRAIGDACEMHGLTLSSWTVCLHNSLLATRHPDHAQTNAFGDVMPHALCPSSPAVQTYMVALARNLTQRYPVRVMELETLNFQGYAQHHYHGKFGLVPGPVESLLFSLCFCAHCEKHAAARGLDMDALRGEVHQQLDRFCEDATPSPQPLDEYIAAHTNINALLALRADIVSDFVRLIRENIDAPVYFYLMGDYAIAGMRYGELAQIADRVVILAYTDSPEQVVKQISGLKKDGVPAEKVIAGMQAYPPASPDADTLRRTVSAAAAEGVAGYCFYNYGIMPRKNLAWVGSALTGVRNTEGKR